MAGIRRIVGEHPCARVCREIPEPGDRTRASRDLLAPQAGNRLGYQRGADAIFPDAWKEFLAPIPVDERGDLLHAYYGQLTSNDPEVRQVAAKAWSIWEGKTSCLYPNSDAIARSSGEKSSLARSRIECHYFINRAFSSATGNSLRI